MFELPFWLHYQHQEAAEAMLNIAKTRKLLHEESEYQSAHSILLYERKFLASWGSQIL